MHVSRINSRSAGHRSVRCLPWFAMAAALRCSAVELPLPDTLAEVIAEHAIAQQGFAIALASNVLQSHVLYVDEVLNGGQDGIWSGACDALDDMDVHSGGVKATASPPTSEQGFPPLVHIEIFYDGLCAARYMVADVALTSSGTEDAPTFSVSNLSTHYLAADGVTPLASLITTASVTLPTDGSLLLHGLGHLVGSAGSNVSADLGLVCGATGGAQALPCAGGIVQDFSALAVAIGSVTPLSLHSAPDDSLLFESVTPAAFSSGAPGSLLVGYLDTTDQALTINGGTTFGSDEVSGQVATFSLLPPPPTGWTSIDNAHDLRFDISVTSASTRSLDMTIKRISTGATQASGHLDQSGSGLITFSDGSSVTVRSWVMGDGSETVFRNGFDQP